jgi:serine/threonine protein kinase
MSSLENEEKPQKLMILGEDTNIQVIGEKGMILHSSRVRKNDTWTLAFETSGQIRKMYQLLRKWIDLSHFLLSLTSYQTIARTKNSVVYKCESVDDIKPRFYALKRINQSKFKVEIEIVQKIMRINNLLPYFVDYLCLYEENKEDSIMIVMKFYSGGSLMDRIKEIGPLQESEIRIVMAALCFVLHVLHQHQILVRKKSR